MIHPLRPFVEGDPELVRKMNEIIQVVNNFNKMTGDTYVQCNRSENGTIIRTNIDAILARVPWKPGGYGGLYRRAKVIAAVGANDYFTANLYHVTTGVEQTTGNEAGVTVYCNISDPSDTGLGLNSCVRLLSVGDIVEVVKHAYDNAGTPEYRWYAVEGFAAFKECVCTEPA